ncbi:SAG-related sequence SRS26C [Toxoplasma gondii VAND]|uniref:SAG-related sequence SRS26C n=1 Tax=Toxoplasma gondii VAND TaxID=933077 RepID=A0A086QE54_TOXGO|nr:SAG-related sequence SRS26C [Toxoplasma gondii VAND]
MRRHLCLLPLFLSAAASFATGSASASSTLSAEINTQKVVQDTLTDPLEGQQCTGDDTTIEIVVGPKDEEATFKCVEPLTTLVPADCTSDSDTCPTMAVSAKGQIIQRVCEDENCESPKPLTDVFPGASRTDDPAKHAYTLTIPKDNRPQKDVWYQCRSPLRTNPCKVKISVAAALADPPENQQCSQAGQTITVDVGPQLTEAAFKCVDPHTTLVPADCTGTVCPPVAVSRSEHTAPRICEDANCERPRLLTDVFPGASRKDDTANHVYLLTIPKDNRPQKDVWYQCRSPLRTNPCKVKISVAAAPIAPPATSQENKCTNTGEVLNVSASPASPVKFICTKDLSLQPDDKYVYENSDDQCQKKVELSTLVDAQLTGVTQPTLTSGDTTYTLTINKMPPKKALLCYKCVGADAHLNSLRVSAGRDAKPECLVKVTVEADPTATDTSTTPTETPSIPTTSSAMLHGSALTVSHNVAVSKRPSRNSPRNVEISVATTLADLSEDHNCYELKGSIAVVVGLKPENQTIKHGGAMTNIVSANWADGPCLELVTSRDVQTV